MKPASLENGWEALAAAAPRGPKRSPFSLVLTDAHMPEMDGFELAQQIRNAPGLTGAVMMMLTSNERAEDISAAGGWGFPHT